MTRVKRAFLAVFLICCSAGFLFAGDLGGEIVYMEGAVDVWRDGKKLDWRNVDIGFFVEPQDTIETGEDGLAEIDVVTPSGTSALVRVKPGTSFYLTEESVQGKSQSSFTMMKGSLSFRVQKLSGNESFNVRTASAVMGVRGTNFDVASSPEGGILVLCDEGAVECADPQGRSALAKPGSVVENVPEAEIAAYAVQPEELEIYRSYWISKRMEVFKSGASTFMTGFIRQYRDLLPRFSAAYREMAANRQLFERYGRGGASSTGSLFQVKSKLSRGVIKMRSILPMFEQVFYRLEVLSEYHDQGLGRTTVNGVSSAAFFNDYKRNLQNVKGQMADVRYLFKLFQEIDQATGGGASGLLESPFSGSGSGSGMDGLGSGMPNSMLDGGF